MPKHLPTITIGADPEIFLKDPKTGKFISAHDKLPGTKIEPFKVPFGAIQVDGVAAEFNIDPSETADLFIRYNQKVIKQIQDRVPGLELVYQPIATFDKKYFKNLPIETRELGCNPDWCAWTGELNPSPNDLGNTVFYRTAAGHIHVGWTRPDGSALDVDPTNPTHKDDCITIVKNLDYYLGMMSLLWDSNKKRRMLYGKAGAMRFKPYGLEYRTMSNVWLSDVGLQRYVWNSAYTCIQRLMQGKESPVDIMGESARYIIDNSINWTSKKALEEIRDKLPPKTDLGYLASWYKYQGINLPPKPVRASITKSLNKATAKFKYTEEV